MSGSFHLTFSLNILLTKLMFYDIIHLTVKLNVKHKEELPWVYSRP